MCTLAVFRGVSPLYPLIVVANRDEFLGRASAPPGPWPGDSSIVAGRDLVAGGTWLGCRLDGSGRVVGILNRRPALGLAASGPGELSRGSLCIDTLKAQSAEAVLKCLDHRRASRYGGFNLFVADLGVAFVVDNGDGVRRVDLAGGLSVLTNLDVNDPRCPRLAGATRRFDALRSMLSGGIDGNDAVAALAGVLSSHQDGVDEDAADQPAALEPGLDAADPAKVAPSVETRSAPLAKTCVHAGDYGTRSSTMIFVRRDGTLRYFHADGAPCATPFREIPIPT